jgi:(heptosyl)LPS beta-1,4-glucosyltransferase
MKPTITAIIITKNEEKMIANCIESLRWCDEILVVDSGSEDRTLSILEKYDIRVIKKKSDSFAELRNTALTHVKTQWLMYVDADERIVPQLSKEILVQIETTKANALTLFRKNMMYGKFFEHGGWGEQVTRIFRRETFDHWVGDVHESSIFAGDSFLLHTALLHLTHRNTVDGLNKTISWTPIEARLLFEAKIPPVKLGTILRKGIMEFFRRAFLKSGRKDGMEGLIEALVQGINRMLVYIQVWELQQQPTLEEKYTKLELEIAQLWKKEK